jgi:hypothetical protein
LIEVPVQQMECGTLHAQFALAQWRSTQPADKSVPQRVRVCGIGASASTH